MNNHKTHMLSFGAAIVLLFQSCQLEQKEVALMADYNQQLSQSAKATTTNLADLKFWDAKLKKNPEQFPFKAKLASAYARIWEQSRNIDALQTSAQLWNQVNDQTQASNSAYLRSEARIAITRHEFKKAYQLLKQAESVGENLRATQLMLFDASMEIGAYQEAQDYLNIVTDYSDVDFLIRLAKWEDYKGNLDKTLFRMKEVLKIARDNKNQALILWTLTNLGDYYGHDGQIKASYQSFIEALKMDPENKYAKKRIAYIAYAHDNNPNEAIRIMQSLIDQNPEPEDYLFLAELATYTEQWKLKESSIAAFKTMLEKKNYGQLYTIPQAELLLEKGAFEAALSLLQKEVVRRPTPETFGALALGLHKAGEKQKAYHIITQYVRHKTFEPSLLWVELQILNHLKIDLERQKEIKTELLEASYELGPLTALEIAIIAIEVS